MISRAWTHKRASVSQVLGGSSGVQTSPLRVWTQAAPVILSSVNAPTTAVLPSADSATERPCLAVAYTFWVALAPRCCRCLSRWKGELLLFQPRQMKQFK